MRNIVLIAAFCALTACKPQPSLDSWMDKWIGPEGTYLQLSRQDDGFSISIQSLDYLESYTGHQVDDHIEFTRRDKIETITAGNGEDTGMKWLLDKKDCLVITKGEGFCRD